jgi:hypothetical protein
MALEAKPDDVRPRPPAEIWKRRMVNIQHRLRRAEDSLEQATSAFDQLVDDLETRSVPAPSLVWKPRARPPRSWPVASRFAVTGQGRSTLTVHGVDFRVATNGIQTNLLRLLGADTKDRTDDLVGFKTIGSLVHALRARGYQATQRSVIVEVSRLRTLLGPINRDLIESRRGDGYRLRLHRETSSG